MIKLNRLPALLLAGLTLCFCQGPFAQSIALTFDDLKDPVAEGQAGISNRLLHHLAAANLKATLFVCGMRVDTATGVEAVTDWQNAGHELGNHTYSHSNLSSGTYSLESFIKDAEKNQLFLAKHSLRATHFRYPYLKEGNTTEKRDGFRQWLMRNDLHSGAVTVDASDWYYDQRFHQWRLDHPNADVAPFKQAYLAHIWNRTQYYDALSKQYLGRSIKHVLLLHANEINAEFLPDLIAMFKSKGWPLIDSAEAYQDAAYDLQPDILPIGESLVWQIAKEAGDKTLRYPGEDESYEQAILDRLEADLSEAESVLAPKNAPASNTNSSQY